MFVLKLQLTNDFSISSMNLCTQFGKSITLSGASSPLPLPQQHMPSEPAVHDAVDVIALLGFEEEEAKEMYRRACRFHQDPDIMLQSMLPSIPRESLVSFNGSRASGSGDDDLPPQSVRNVCLCLSMWMPVRFSRC